MAKRTTKKKTIKKATKKKTKKKRSKGSKTARIDRPYPRESLEEALKIPYAIKNKNGGNPWAPELVSKAAYNIVKGNKRFFYLAAAARDYGLVVGARDSKDIALTDLGRSLAYAPNKGEELKLKKQVFLNVEKFKAVLEYYKGSDLPEMNYLRNTLENEFGLCRDTHEEFSKLFRENCEYLGIGEGFAGNGGGDPTPGGDNKIKTAKADGDLVIYAEPESDSAPLCFVIMPFSEKGDDPRPNGFFVEVLKHLIAPAGANAGFKVATARRTGSDVIHATILKNLISADLVVADLSDHNPNVLFELGVRMAHDKPVQLIRATGTGPIFDVDHVLRVFDYSPNIWPSTIEADMPKLTEHIEGTWASKKSKDTYMNLLLRGGE
jgi:hypothetical protein